MKKSNCDLSRRGFLAAAFAAGVAGAARSDAMPKMPGGLARGDAQSTTSGREGLKAYVTPYFYGDNFYPSDHFPLKVLMEWP